MSLTTGFRMRPARARRRGPRPVGAATPLLVLAALALSTVAPAAAAAQTALSLTGGFGSFTGGDFSGTPPGPTVGGALHVLFAEYDDLEATLGIDYSRYGRHGYIGATRQFDYWASLRRLAHSGRVDVVAGIKVGYSTRSLSVVDEPARTDGFLAGPTASLRVPTSFGASVALGVDVAYHTYEELIMYASREHGTDQDGFRVLMRLGVVIPLALSIGEGEGF